MAKFRLIEPSTTDQEEPQKPSSKFKLIPEKEPNAFKENVKEVIPQFTKGASSGLLGSYGDIFDILGLNINDILPGEKLKRDREFETLSKLEKGKVPSVGELQELSDDDELPRYSKLPTSREASEFIEELGGPGKPKTVTGRTAERAGRFTGSGLAFGSLSPKQNIAAGTVGQGLEELGAPGWVQAAGEIVTFAKTHPNKTSLTSNSPEIKNKINELKRLGYSEEDITLAKNALEDRGVLKKISSYLPKTEKQFKKSFEVSEEKFNKIIHQGFPGLKESGPEGIKKASSELFDNLDEFAKNVKITNPKPFVEKADKAIEEIKRTLANTPQEKQVIELLENAIKASSKESPGDFYTSFYQGLNSVGNWKSPKQREHVFSVVKNAIKDTFKQQGPEGQKLATVLEEANKSWMKYLQAEDVSNLIQKASTDEGLNFAKMTKLLQNPDNYETFSKALGKQQADNLKLIAKTGESIKDLEKKMQGGLTKEALGAGKYWAIAKAIATGDLNALKTYVGSEVLGRVATKLLTDPKYQNLQLRMLNAIRDSKWDQLRVLAMNAENEFKKDQSKRSK